MESICFHGVGGRVVSRSKLNWPTTLRNIHNLQAREGVAASGSGALYGGRVALSATFSSDGGFEGISKPSYSVTPLASSDFRQQFRPVVVGSSR